MADDDDSPKPENEETEDQEERNDVVVKIGLVGDAQVGIP